MTSAAPWPRCHLPKMPVWQPLARRSLTKAGSVLSMGVLSVVTPLMWFYVPVRIAARRGHRT